MLCGLENAASFCCMNLEIWNEKLLSISAEVMCSVGGVDILLILRTIGSIPRDLISFRLLILVAFTIKSVVVDVFTCDYKLSDSNFDL